MITLQDLCLHLNDLYEPELFKDFCPNGLQVEGKENIEKIATAVTANLDTIELAVEMGVDALICHHGLFWGREPAVITGALKKKIQLLLDAGISLFGYHLPMDAHPRSGNNFCAAHDLGFSEVRLIEGTVGVVATVEQMPRVKLKGLLEEYYGHSAASAEKGPDVVRKIGILSGGGWRYMEQAAKEGADTFVSGSFDEPAWTLASDLGLNFYALGHSATERVGPKHLATHLQEGLSIKTEFIDVFNPF